MQKQLTAIIEREGNGYVSLCPQLDIASQGDSVQEARENLREALELFFESASPSEIQERLDCVIGPPLCEPLIGQLVLQQLDLVVDCARRTLTPRPESPNLPLLKLK